jgi:MFS family permease
MVYGVSSLLGPTVGGWLAEHGPLLGQLVTEESRWRWVFYLNVPIGLVAVVALLIFLPANLSVRTSTWQGWQSLRTIDFPGALLCAAATISLILGLTWGGDQIYAWNSVQVLSVLVAGLVLFGLFVFVEKHSQEPILPLDLFRNLIFSAGALLSLLQAMVLLGFSLYVPLFLQGVLAVSPTNAGLVMTPFSLSMVLGAMLSSAMISKLKRSQVVAIIGAALMSTGALLIALMTPATSLPQAILFMVLAGTGTGTFFSLPMLVVQNALPQSRLGVSTAALRYLGQIGASLGIAIVGTAITSASSGNLLSHLPTSAASRLALSGALTHGFVAILIFALLALAATFFLKDQPLKMASDNDKQESMNQNGQEVTQELVHA